MKENFVVVLLRDSFEKQSTEFGAIFECVFCLWGQPFQFRKFMIYIHAMAVVCNPFW